MKFLYKILMGEHPNNTIFFFNFHNVRHINRFLKRQIPILQQRGNKNILVDVGAGKSPYYPWFKNYLQEYVAIDVEGALPAQENRPMVRQISAFAEKLPLPNDYADIILSNQVLEHVIDPVQAVQEKFRILKSGGIYIGSVPHLSPVHLEPYDFRRFTDLGVKQLLENAGFINIKIEGSGGIYTAIALILSMDWMLSKRKDGKEQKFSAVRALLLSPLVAFLNVSSLILDKILGDKKRSPANLCWTAYKP
ncbi:MAG: methyltransferase domain-containing protein [Sphingobacteriales bacterium]|nr:methyltransferase domain-containing protein [Sphingobacteriales bacterium]